MFGWVNNTQAFPTGDRNFSLRSTHFIFSLYFNYCIFFFTLICTSKCLLFITMMAKARMYCSIQSHPSILYCLSRGGSRWQQVQQSSPGICLGILRRSHMRCMYSLSSLLQLYLRVSYQLNVPENLPVEVLIRCLNWLLSTKQAAVLQYSKAIHYVKMIFKFL